MYNYILLLGLLIIFLMFYKSSENFENNKNTKECSRLELNKAIYDYNVNIINRGAR